MVARIRVERLWTHDQLDQAPVHAHLDPPRLEPLYNVRLRYWRGCNLVLQGVQRAAAGRQSEATYEQVWWCRVLVDIPQKEDSRGMNAPASPIDGHPSPPSE